MIYFVLALCAWLSGYRDMIGFVYREKTWTKDQLADWLPYWEASQVSKKDPWHMAGGAMWALLAIVMAFDAVWFFFYQDLFFLKLLFAIKWSWYWLVITFILHALIIWQGFYWIRNMLMHYFGRSKASRDWHYLLPPPLHKLFKKK